MNNFFVNIYEGIKSKAVITGLLLLVLGGIGKDVYNNLSLPADKAKFDEVNKSVKDIKENQTIFTLNQGLMAKDVSNSNSTILELKTDTKASFQAINTRLDLLLNQRNAILNTNNLGLK